MASVFGSLGYTMGGLTAAELIPTWAVLNRAGLLNYARRPGLFVLLPAFFGLQLGCHVFGCPEEVATLKAGQIDLSQEMIRYKKSLMLL